MREPCETFQEARGIDPRLKTCPRGDIEVIRPRSGHGSKVCERCKGRNRDEQRTRENSRKRERRAKLKRDKMTAGIGSGNVVWTGPEFWTPSVIDAQTLALHSPQPRRFNTLKVRSMTQALHYGPKHRSINTAKVEQTHIDVSHHDCEVYSQPPRQVFTATMSDILLSQENSPDMNPIETRDNTNLCHGYEHGPQNIPSPPTTAASDGPACQPQKSQPVGLGITVPDDTKQGQSHTETCSFNEWSFRMELHQWSSVFEEEEEEEDDGVDYAKEL